MIAFVYYHFFVKDITIGVNNINDQIAVDVKKEDELTEEEKDVFEERWFMEANYYSNDKDNGVQLQELRYNYFTSYKLTQADYRSTGMQFMGDYKHTAIEVDSADGAGKHVFNEFFYYDTTNGISWNGYGGNDAGLSTTLNRDQTFIIKIDNRPFSIQLTGGYDIYGDKRFLGFLWKTGKKVVGHYYYTYPEVFECVFNAIKSNSKGYGDYYVTVDLSDFFTVKEYDAESGKFKDDDVTDIIKNYAVLKFHYNENGARNSSQSLFGVIGCNPNYDLSEDKIDTTYWQERVLYNLGVTSKLNGADLFNYRYSEVYEGYFVSLSMDGKKLFADMPRTKVNITIDLQSAYLAEQKINIVGFDYNAFESLEIDTLIITGNATVTVLDKALHDTQLKTLKRSQGIILNFAENATNNEFAEVVL
jgi:hypothetical protein